MFRHYLLITLKHLWKRRLYSFITLLSLTLGMSVFSLIVLHVKRELSYNQGWPDSERIYRLYRDQKEAPYNSGISVGFNDTVLVELKKFLADSVDGYAEIGVLSLSLEDKDISAGLNLALVNAQFLDVFSFEVLEGSLEQVMQTPGLIALSRQHAALLLGEQDSYLGQTLELSGDHLVVDAPDFIPGSPTQFEVGAIYDLPTPLTRSSHFEGIAPRVPYSEALISRLQDEPVITLSVWLKLAAGLDAGIPEEQLLTFVDEYSHLRDLPELGGQRPSEFYQYKLQSIEDTYFDPVVRDFPSGNMGRVITFSVIGLFVLLAGCSNAVSLGLAGALERRREVGIRKAVGAVQSSIVLHYLGESMTLALLAMVPVLVLTEWLHPMFAQLLSITGMPGLGPPEVTLLLAIVVGVGLMNGLYPALVLARVKPVAVLKAHSTQPRLRRFNVRSVLVGSQFTLSIMLLIGTLGLYSQLHVTRQQPLGFDHENMVQAWVNSEVIMAGGRNVGGALAERLEKVPGIRSATGGLSLSLTPTSTPETQYVIDQQQAEGVSAARRSILWEHFDFMGIPLLAGREFEAGRDMVNPPTETLEEALAMVTPVVINRAAMKALGYTSPEQAVNARFYRRHQTGPSQYHYPLEVIGVVEDSRLSNIRARASAEVYSLSNNNISMMVLFRYDEVIEERLQGIVNNLWVDVTGYPADLYYLDDQIAQAYSEEQRESQLLLICAGLALFLSSVGLFGLVSVAMRSQTKEVGVRKVLGATTTWIVVTFLRRYSIPVLLANLIAWPIAVYFVLQWIERFPYQLDKAWLFPICIGASLLVLLIAMLTVAGLTLKAANTKPVRSLRYE